MEDELIKEDDNFIWRQTKSGLGYVYSKNAFWLIQEIEADECIKNFNNNLFRPFLKKMKELYNNDNDTSKDQEAS